MMGSRTHLERRQTTLLYHHLHMSISDFINEDDFTGLYLEYDRAYQKSINTQIIFQIRSFLFFVFFTLSECISQCSLTVDVLTSS